MTDDRVLHDRLIAFVCERTQVTASTVEAVMRAQLEFLLRSSEEA